MIVEVEPEEPKIGDGTLTSLDAEIQVRTFLQSSLKLFLIFSNYSMNHDFFLCMDGFCPNNLFNNQTLNLSCYVDTSIEKEFGCAVSNRKYKFFEKKKKSRHTKKSYFALMFSLKNIG